MKGEERPYFVKDSFVLYRSYLEHIELLSSEDRGTWITAVLHYVSDLPLPEMKPEVRMAFSFVRARIDEDYLKYQETLEKKRKAGQKGGIASGISRRNEASDSSASKNEANEHDNEYVYDNDYDNDTVYDNDHTSYISGRKQTAKEARRGVERDVDLDAIILEQIINRPPGSWPEPQDDDLEYLGIPDPGKGR